MKTRELIFGTALTLIMASCVFLSKKSQESIEVNTPLITDDKSAEAFTLSANMTLIYIDSSGNQIVKRGR